MKFPKNILLTFTHGGFAIPDYYLKKLHPDMRNNEDRLIRNFSDFGTLSLCPKQVVETQIVSAHFSRALGDPNRALDAEDVFRETDFNGNPLWAVALTRLEKDELIRDNYDVYHEAIQQKIDTGKFDLLIDIHDTGNRLLAPLTRDDTTRVPPFPDMCVSNGNGETCSPELLEKFASLLREKTGLDVHVNEPYTGGYVTRYYGDQLSTIQVEINRGLYMDERRMAVEPEQAGKLRSQICEVLCELGSFL